MNSTCCLFCEVVALKMLYWPLAKNLAQFLEPGPASKCFLGSDNMHNTHIHNKMGRMPTLLPHTRLPTPTSMDTGGSMARLQPERQRGSVY